MTARFAWLPIVAAAALCFPSHVRARETLGYDAMASAKYPASVDLSAYGADAGARPPSHRFEGRLRIAGKIQTHVLVADMDFVRPGDVALARTLPDDFDQAFVQHGDALIPVRRGPIPGSHGWWEFVLEPGRVWDEPGDHGYSRAAIPFALVQKNANCTHNGVLMFLFDDEGIVGQASIQVSGETCQYLQMDMWGMLDAAYIPGKIADAAGVVSSHDHEVAFRLPVRPLSVLAHDHPGIIADAFAIGSPQSSTRHGVFVDGVHYASSCATRHGDYPYCEVMDLPSFSVAKTAAAGIALMRMQALHPGIADERVADHVPATGCRSPKWDGVRFIDLLDMASGHYEASAYMADEDSPAVVDFFRPTDHPHKLAFSCEAYPRREAPGKRWVYHTSDTYLLGVALNAYLRSSPASAGKDIFTDVVDADIYQPLDLSPTARATRRTYDKYAQPFLGWGLTLHADDIVKLARFMGPDKGAIDGQSLLDGRMLDEAMQRAPARRGLQVATLDRYRYQHGVWARNVQRELGCEHPTWVPFMSGFGGITVAMFPNGAIWYNVADDGQLASIDFAAPAREIRKFGDYCASE